MKTSKAHRSRDRWYRPLLNSLGLTFVFKLTILIILSHFFFSDAQKPDIHADNLSEHLFIEVRQDD